MEIPTNLHDVLLMEILARLSMRSISRFKSVCKTWKTTFESLYFRRRFLSLHQNSSPSWSLIRGKFIEEELMGSYGCQTWNLPKSPYYYFPRPSTICRRNYVAYSCSSNGLVMLKVLGFCFYIGEKKVLGSALFVGNLVLQKWVKIPKAPHESRVFGLVTQVDMDGVVLSFKVVELEVNKSSTCMHVHIYSSETGIWTSKQLQCHKAYSFKLSPISLNGTLYLLSKTMIDYPERGVLIAHDFYSETDQCQIIPLPNEYKSFYKKYIKGYLTTSGGGFLMYVDTFVENTYNIFKIWKLNNDSAWQVLWEIDLSFLQSDISYGEPIAMHPFDSDIVYLRCYRKRILVSYNLRTQNFRILRDASNSTDHDHMHQDCLMGDIMEYSRFPVCDAFLYQFVLPRWMESVPCPPQTEIINTASLFPARRKRERST